MLPEQVTLISGVSREGRRVMGEKNDTVDRILKLLGRPELGPKEGSTGYKAALQHVNEDLDLALDPKMSKPRLAEAIAAAAGEPWDPSYDSRSSPSRGGSTVTLEGWWTVERAVLRLQEAVDADETSAVEEVAGALLRGRPPKTDHLRQAKRRRAVEMRAVEVASAHYGVQGYDVEDVGATESFDLLCKRGSEELHVEVKGTTGLGRVVNLTANEVTHSRDYPDVALVIVDRIRMVSDTAAEGGHLREIRPWSADDARLTSTAYRYQLP